jgi:hypothetical protein
LQQQNVQLLAKKGEGGYTRINNLAAIQTFVETDLTM